MRSSYYTYPYILDRGTSGPVRQAALPSPETANTCQTNKTSKQKTSGVVTYKDLVRGVVVGKESAQAKIETLGQVRILPLRLRMFH